MTTFLDLKTRVQRRLIDAPIAVVAEVPLLVNDVYAELQEDHKFWDAQATLEASTTAGSHVLAALPGDWGGFRSPTSYLTTDLGDSRRIVNVKSEAEIAVRWNNEVDIGEPRHLLETLTELQVWPLPDGNADWSDGEYRVKVPYWSKLPELSDDVDETWLTTLARTYLIAEAVRRGFMLDWDEARAIVWGREADKAKAQLMLRDKAKWLQGAEPMVPYLDVFQAKIPE